MSSTDPFDELRGEVENNLSLLQDQVSRAEKEIPYPSRETVDELLLSLQATREDADLLRSACRTLRRRVSTGNSDAMLATREQFCESTDSELDRIQIVIEDMQRKLISKQDRTKNNNSSSSKKQHNNNEPRQNEEMQSHYYQNDHQKPSAAPAAATSIISSSSGVVSENDDRSLLNREEVNSLKNNENYQFNDEPQSSKQPGSPASSNNNVVIVDNRQWDREAALKKIKMRQKRRETEEETTLDDLEPKHDGTLKGKAIYYYQQFQAWAIDFVDTLSPNQRIGWLVGMTFVVILLIVALFSHH